MWLPAALSNRSQRRVEEKKITFTFSAVVWRDVLLKLLPGRRVPRAPSVESSRDLVHGLLNGCLFLLGQNQLPQALLRLQTREPNLLWRALWYAISLQRFNLASFWSGAASFGEFAVAFAGKGCLTQLENASEAGDFSSLSQPDVCWWGLCQGETHEMLCTGAQRAAVTKGCGQQSASEPLAWFDTHSPCTAVGSLVFSDQLTSVLELWTVKIAELVLWSARVKWSWMPSPCLFKQQNSSQAGTHVHPCPGALGMLSGDQGTPAETRASCELCLQAGISAFGIVAAAILQ